ncbi:MAG: hypothetical protein ACI9VM_000269 [Candidatus Azotimanducaceae bacterium]|jgi:hypothetical protein
MILKHLFFLYAFVCTVFLLSPLFIHAQSSDDFIVSQTVVGTIDSTPPTVPANFAVAPISVSQIDLVWDVSSDNVGVGGYQVFRDAAQIATTTLSSYSDTGLSSSTLYTYFITAFDTSFNYATPTAALATTTLAPSAAPIATTTPVRDGGYSVRDIEIINLVDSPTQHSIEVSFDTNVYTRAIVRWGRTRDYEGGFTATEIFKERHHTIIDGLEPGTIYEIEIYLIDRFSREELKRTLTIKTDSGPDTEPPPNVSDFRAQLQGLGAALTWTNPDIDDFSHVRVLSSDYFYPTHIADGWLVYDGTAEAVQDERTLEEGVKRYYTVFAYDTAGNISSGAVTSVVRGVVDKSDPQIVTVGTPATTTIDGLPVFVFDDIRFSQNGERVPVIEGVITLQGGLDTTISIPYELLPEHLKTIVMTLEHPLESGKVFSFLLRIDPQKESYVARIGPLGESGTYSVHTEVFNFKTQELFAVDGQVDVDVEELISGVSDKNEASSGFIGLMRDYRFGLLIFLVLLLLFILYRRMGKEKHEDYYSLET